MHLRSRILDLWKDPVGSNLIAAAIVGGVSYLFLRFLATASPSPWLSRPVARLVFPAVLIVLVLATWHYYRGRSKTLVFLSAGGTCRDPMAKAIFGQLLDTQKPRPRIRIRAAGRGPEMGTATSYAARYVIREMFGRDILRYHRPQLLTPELMKEADLILVMDQSLLLTRDENKSHNKTLPNGKTFLLKEFLGSHGDVVDPWPDGKDDATVQRYRACAEELRALLTSGMDRIVKTLEVS